MGRIQRFLAGLSPRAMALLLSLALISLHAILLAGALLRWQSARRLGVQIETIHANIDELDDSEREELRRKEEELAAVEAEIHQLEDDLPDPSAPFPLYEHAQEIAASGDSTLVRIERSGIEQTSGVAGEINALAYVVQVQADLSRCMDYISRLELRGGVALSVQNTLIEPSSEICNFEVLTVALTER